MISRLGLRIAAVFRATAPDPFVIAILLTGLTALLALAIGFRPDGASQVAPMAERAWSLLDAWGVKGGLWSLLAFGMQMCLILVTGHALAESRPVAAGLRRLAALPQSGAQAAALVAGAACLAGVVNWGLGLIVGAILARDVGRSAAARGVRVHYPLLAAAGYMGLLVFHGGISGSAPLAMSSLEGAKKVLGAEQVLKLGVQPIGLDETLGSTLNLFVTGGMLILLPALFALLTPRDTRECRGAGDYIREAEAAPTGAEAAEPGGLIPEWLERTPWLVIGLGLALALAVGRFAYLNGAWQIGFDQVNMAMLALGLLLHGSARSYLRSLEAAASGCAGIILQFPIYAGIMAMMTASGLTRIFAEAITAHATSGDLSALTFGAATLVGLFVPSGGAQWSIQGPIALQTGTALGVDHAHLVMAVAYGDELANMLQPFWALPLLAITGVKARDIVGYTAIAMVVAGAWMAMGLLVF